MTDDSERDPARSQRPAPPYKRRPGDVWREELPPITRYLYDFKSEQPEPQFQPLEFDSPREPVLESIEWKTPVPAQARMTPQERETGAWILEEWEQYDWRKAATLTADPDIVAAQHAWDDLDWEDDARGEGRRRQPEMVATILEAIARRIRAGELRVGGGPGMTDEAALTAVLAALLGVR
ncbi:MAG TPA: hypothetical protein VMY38_08515, partial [Gemmatimonadaceae bacterium]|nr:hypothetical protein [Gemmatimonadaceae bacterium]